MYTQQIRFLESLTLCEFALAAVMLLVFRLRADGEFPRARLFLWFKIISIACLAPFSFHRMPGLSVHTQYGFLFYGYWSAFVVEAIVSFLLITELFQLSVAPLPGLRRLGMLAFKWVAAISIIIALATSISPTMTSKDFLVSVASQLQRSASLLQICLLGFLYVVARPLGMSYRSRLLGLSMGLAILAGSDLLFSAWFSHLSSLYSTFAILHAAVPSVALLIWLAHFMLPEPSREPITLPVTSPLLRWNEIAQSLGKSGGRVLITQKAEVASKDFAALDKAIRILETRAS